ncbi:uncharacterized protein LOC120904003 isoform X2 [Anopheles arabiensis]|uniref:uncharacterized protein LOC120904003 isoform X2 n=1 Tax=Anopheles arabiensis TaxID=7173 RepID=UPI001AAD264E|nr:uncharacterized protein LOC120904003 isoform X2 [Anopheles arabiensis]
MIYQLHVFAMIMYSRQLRCICLLLCVVCFVPALLGHKLPLTCGRIATQTIPLIRKGISAVDGQWPWHAAIFHRKNNTMEYACGGSIIDQSTILTAAHCVTSMHGVLHKSKLTVHVGRIHLQEVSEHTQVHLVGDVILHPHYSMGSVANDIALIKLAINITMSKHVQPVCLWTMSDSEEPIVNRNGTIVGFGFAEQDKVSDTLRSASIRVVDTVTCLASDRSLFGTHLTPEMFCGIGRPGVSACNGDSGGGMVFEIGGRWFVRGIVSFTRSRASDNVCDGKSHTAYTDVAKYIAWITKHIDPRMLHYPTNLHIIDYEEKLRLFNFTTCGIIPDLEYLPWHGFIGITTEGVFIARCIVTLIAEWYVVCPAHCLASDEPRVLEIHVGRNYSAQTSQQVLHIESVTIHPHYYNNSFVDNIALIQLSTPANTSHWSITPICVAVTPDLQCNHSLNLTVSTSKEPQQSVKSVDVSVLSDSICIEKYGRFGINPTLANKRFCAQTHQPCNFSLIAEKYTPHISGAILQQARTFAGETHSQHFLIGFDLMGRHCDLNMPPIYLNASAYMDWILYNMKLPVQNVTHIDMETDWSKLLQGPDSEKLRLFNMTTCGIQAYNYTMTSYPWTGRIAIYDKSTCRVIGFVVLISEWYALASASIMTNLTFMRFIILGGGKLSSKCNVTTYSLENQVIEIKTVYFSPDFNRNTGQNSIALIEFWQPADISNPYIRPICLPFAESMQNNKLNQFVALASDSLSKQFSNVRRTNFTLINMTTCRQRCEQEGILLNPADVTLCAIHRNAEDKKWNKISTGSALQARLDFDGQKRYFLRGLHFRRKGQYEKNDHLGNPVYLFEDIYRYLGWILSIVSIRKGNDAFLEPVNTLALRSEIVISPPVKQYKKRRMFNFSTCGITANVSNRIHPWLGKLRSNAPSFDVIECTVILISEWYVICTARSASNDTEKMIELGFNTHSEDVQKIPIGQITVHHLYEAHPQMHDMALIRLARSAIITELSVVPICLPILEDVRSYTKDNLATFRLVPDYETDKLDEVFSCLEGFSLLRMNLSDTFRFVTYCCMWQT